MTDKTSGKGCDALDGPARKKELSQYMTSPAMADFLCSLIPLAPKHPATLLDPCAGTGELSSAFIRRWFSNASQSNPIYIDAFEIDTTLATALNRSLAKLDPKAVKVNVVTDDFISANDLSRSRQRPRLYQYIVMNPPYRKLHSNSPQAKLLRSLGLSATNSYSAFLAIGLRLLEPGGVLAAIVPRSFCNGRYYHSLRRQLLEESAILRIHVFESRTDAFKHDGVIQENIVLVVQKDATQGPVHISFSRDSKLDKVNHVHRPLSELLLRHGEYSAISLSMPTEAKSEYVPDHSVPCHLTDLGVDASTGPVVDFRQNGITKLRDASESAVPLIHSHHIQPSSLKWPAEKANRMDTINLYGETSNVLLPPGNYVAIRRFSSNEQSRRIISNPIDGTSEDFARGLSFENHVNYLHSRKHGLDREVSWGLAAYLNSATVDRTFRGISGSTQVNVSDLRLISFPPIHRLKQIGVRVLDLGTVDATVADQIVSDVLLSGL